VDRRGRGDSSHTEGHSLEQEQEDIAAVAKSLVEPTFALGHSYGGLCVLGAALASPGTFRKIAVYEAPWTGSRTATLAQHMPALEEDLARGDADGLVYRFMTDVLTVPRTDADVLRKSPLWGPFVADSAASMADWRAMLGYEFLPDAFKTLPPTLLITGADSPRDMYVTESLLAVHPDAKEVSFAGQAHVAHLLDAARFADELTRFFLA
jgi:pimeloyl-ACP methyl ester carboxylesterase